MAKISVYYDYFEDQLCPIWMIIYFGQGHINWNSDTVYFPIDSPFERHMAEDFSAEVMSLSVSQNELLLHPNKPGYFGINKALLLKQIKKEYKEADPFEVEQFIIQISDLEEILQMDVRKYYDWK
jgi:hypothetical protein